MEPLGSSGVNSERWVAGASRGIGQTAEEVMAADGRTNGVGVEAAAELGEGPDRVMSAENRGRNEAGSGEAKMASAL